MTRDELVETLTLARQVMDNDIDVYQLRVQLTKFERTRTLAFWHDHSTLLGKGYVLITAKILYDAAVFKTQHEIESEGVHSSNIQTEIEQPQLHVLVLCSSSVEDQAALIRDRKECMQELSISLETTNGIPITDELVFFYGDKAAQQVERGTQQGGTYKCGSCGCEAHMMDNLAYSLRCMWRSLTDLQSLALAGKYGKQAGIVRPFQSPNAKQLQEELRIRNVYHTHTTKGDLQKELSRVLKGVERVPTLLLDTPEVQLRDINLHWYCILDCEPLHDIKGHLMNLFTELPYIITDRELRTEVVHLQHTVVPKEKPSCGDYRWAAIRLFALLNGKASTNVCMLMSTIIEMSEIFYAHDDYITSPGFIMNCAKTFSQTSKSLDGRNSLDCTFMQSPAMPVSNMKLCASDPVMQKMKNASLARLKQLHLTHLTIFYQL